MKVRLRNRLGNTPANTTIDTSDSQGEWLISRGHADAVAEPSGGDRAEPATAEDNGERPLEEWTVAELRDYADRLGVAQRGSKADLIERITDAENGE